VTELVEPAALEDLTSAETMATRRADIRARLGLGGAATSVARSRREKAEPLRPLLREAGVTIYPAAALGVLGIVDTFQGAAFTVLTPEISHSLGLSIGLIGLARVLQFFATVAAPLPMAALSQGRGRRAVLCVVTGLAWSIITVFTGFAVSLVALILVLVLDGLSTGSVAALHTPLVADSYPPTVRVRMLTTYSGLVTFGSVLSPLTVALLAGPLNLTWRGVFLVMGLMSLSATLGALGLRDPGPGRFDTELVREHRDGDEPESHRTQLRFFEITRRLLILPTIQRMCAGYLVFGILLIPFQTFLSEFLAQRWGLSSGARGLFFAGTAAAGVGALVAYARVAESIFRRSAAAILTFGGNCLAVGVGFIVLGALSPVFIGMVVCFCVGSAFVTMLTPGLNTILVSIVDSRYRPHAAALVGLFTAAGAVLGIAFLNGISTQYGVNGSLISLAVPGVVGALLIRRAAASVEGDIDRMVTTLIETDDIAAIAARGGRLPMLSSRRLDFSYGQLQVLFDVDFTVDDGEMVALLGTNGAGKSTLLKVISGIGLPSSGTVRFRGEDITYLDAERRLDLGITQIPGGRAVFGPLDVMENLRLFGYAAQGSKRDIEESIDRCLEAFPRLAQRRTSLASTLSGGEQQMLGLSKALILRPKLLLIDELSLGLAPIVVGQLLDMVRRINAEGTAVVLVEQSVNIALSLVDHAYFMEKGEMRFDGPAKELLQRNDLLRAVFLEGATQGTRTASAASGRKATS
jgi:ABC-type branched-subunit amino acid transport system ATPase component/sugar phosphate permease